VPNIIVLDTNPLSNSAIPSARIGKVPTKSQECRQWLADCVRRGMLVLVPAISYYEALRELERRGATTKIARLKEFVFGTPGRYVPLTTEHLEIAARLWGVARNAGSATASNDALDGDVILAAQVISLELGPADYTVATSNVGHLAQFVNADNWSDLTA